MWQNLAMETSLPNILTITPVNTNPFLASCPACGLLCDDILINVDEQNINVVNTDCSKSIQFFEQQSNNVSPQINGKPVALNIAIAHAASLLKNSQSPLFAGLSTDVQGFRTIYNIAQKTNGSLQHMNSQSMARNMAVLQSTGWQTTTLTEVKNRADVILCVGTDIVSHNPRFFERFVWLNKPNTEAMFTDAMKRSIIYIGEDLDTSAGISPEMKAPLVLDCKTHQLPGVMASLRALINGKTLKSETVAGIKISDLSTVAKQLKQAKYAVLAWIAKDLDYSNAELTIGSITEIIALLNQNDANRTGRAAGLMLGGSDGDTSANNANTWLTGLTLSDDAVEHDCAVWVNSFSPEKISPFTDKPLIELSNSNSHFAKTPNVFIPIATPGLDCSGTLFRVDSSVVLPLKQVRQNELLSLSDVLNAIEALL